MTVTAQPRNERINDLVLVDVSEDARDAARDAADARLTNELQAGSGVRRFMKSIWKGNLAKEYYRQKYISEAHRDIVESQDVLHHELGDSDADQQARYYSMQATINRYQSEYEEMIHTDAGEQREVLAEHSSLSNEIKGLIRDFAAGSLSPGALNEEFTRTVAAYRESGGQELKGTGVVQLSNMIEVAQQVKAAVEHGESIDTVMEEFGVVTGEARTGVRTDAKYDRVERVINKIHSSKIGSLVSPEAIVAGVSVAASLARFGSEKALAAAAKTVSVGLGAGVLIGLRERKRTTDERTQHTREMAQGKTFNANSERRTEMEAARYQTVNAREMTETLEHLTGEDTLDDGGHAAVQAAMLALARAETLVQLSDQRNIDLISYSDVGAVAEERFALDLARAQAKVALRQQLDDDTRAQLGYGDMQLDEILESGAAAYIETIDSDISDKDAAFVKLRRRRMLKAGARGAALGLVLGAATQEAIAGMSDTRMGVIESLHGDAQNQPAPDGMQHNTLLYGLLHGDTETIHHAPSGSYEQHDIGDMGKVNIPDDYRLVDHGNGNSTLVRPDGVPVVDLAFEDDGTLSQSTIDFLQAKGLQLENLSYTTTETEYVDVHTYIGSEHDSTVQVKRELWYDNNTPAPKFDENELGMWWGGDNNTGLTGSGDYTFTVANMQSGGSYHGSERADWAQEAENGTLKLAVSATKDTQAHVFMLDIKPNGEVIIPQDSPAAALFAEEGGRAVFKGAYAETVQITGIEDGTTRMRPLATVVGENNPGKIPIETVTEHPEYKITPTGYDETKQMFTEMAPVVPIDRRRSMETVQRAAVERTPGVIDPYYYRSQYGSFEGAQVMIAELDRHGSPRLRDNPDAQLDPGEELEWFVQSLRENGREQYAVEIEQQIAASPELSSVDESLESIITIPVKASGQEESENIYKLLSAYASQDREALGRNLMLLHVNWPQSGEVDPESAQRIQHTLAEIERARTDFPDLKIATIQSRWTQQELDGGVIGRVADKMRDAALIALNQKIQAGVVSSRHEVQIVRNDADAKGIHRNYLQQMQKAFRENQEADVFTGTTRFDSRRAGELPGMVAGQNFASLVEIVNAGRERHVHTGGANFGVRASILASIAPALARQSSKGVGSDDVMIGRFIAAARSRNTSYTPSPRTAERRASGDGAPIGNAYYFSPVTRTNRKVGVRVGGAQIDTDSQRSEEVWLNGGAFHQTWDGSFDEGGHRERGTGLDTADLEAERARLRSDINGQVMRLEADMRYTIKIAGGIKNPATKTALAVTFSGIKNGVGYRVKGDSIELTPEGRSFLVNRLQRDGKGRFDAYGSRLRRQLYGEVGARSRRQSIKQPLISVI